jgi:hypothetical protein
MGTSAKLGQEVSAKIWRAHDKSHVNLPLGFIVIAHGANPITHILPTSRKARYASPIERIH